MRQLNAHLIRSLDSKSYAELVNIDDSYSNIRAQNGKNDRKMVVSLFSLCAFKKKKKRWCDDCSGNRLSDQYGQITRKLKHIYFGIGCDVRIAYTRL